MLSLNVDGSETNEDIRTWANNLGITYSLLQDNQYSVANLFGVSGIPHNAILDTSMKVIYTAAGYSTGIHSIMINHLNQYYQPAYTNNISLSHGFMQLGVDTLIINSQSTNPGNHNLEIYAMIVSMDGYFIDSLQLYDDGAHDDGADGDGNYGNSMVAPMVEQEFKVGIKTFDTDYSVTTSFDDLDRFTTVGPLTVVGCTEILRISNRIYYKMEIMNYGSTTAAQNVQAKITVTDPYATGILNDFQNFGTIAAGSSALSSGNFGVNTVNLPATHTFVFHAKIYSNSSLYWEDSTSVIVGILDNLDNLPQVFSIKQNYPNPFNPKTTIEFSIPNNEFVELKIFDVNGKEIHTLVNDNLTAGSHKYDWITAESIASGIYYYTIKAGEFTNTKKLILLK